MAGLCESAYRHEDREALILEKDYQKFCRFGATGVPTHHREVERFDIDYLRANAAGYEIFIPAIEMINSLFMRTIEQTTQEVLSLAAEHFHVPAGSLAPSDDFFNKLGINSLQALELLTRIENHFTIELPDYEMQGVSDFKTLAERIQSRL